MNYKKNVKNKCIKWFFIFAVFLFVASNVYGSEKSVYCSLIVEINDNSNLINFNISTQGTDFFSLEIDENYFFSLVGKDGKIIKKEALRFLGETPISSAKDNIYAINFLYSGQAEKITVNDKNGAEKLLIDLTPYKTCGNGVCETDENYKVCSLDCPAGTEDGYCDRIRDGICDPDCSVSGEFRDSDCIAEKKSTEKIEKTVEKNLYSESLAIGAEYNYIKIIIFLFLAVLGASLIFFGIKKFKKNNNS